MAPPTSARQHQKDSSLDNAKRIRRRSVEDEESRIRRHVKSLLNKLTIELFERVSSQLADSLESSSDEVSIKIHTEEVFNKAISEPNFSDMYADLVIILFAKSPNFVITSLPDGTTTSTKVAVEEVMEVANSTNQLTGLEPTLRPTNDDPSLQIPDSRRSSHSSIMTNNTYNYENGTPPPSNSNTGATTSLSQPASPGSPTLSHADVDEVEGAKQDVVNFRIEFLNRCQNEFNELLKHNALEFDRPSEMSDEDYELEIKKRKRRVLGNIRFIGELAKRNILRLRITRIVVLDLLSGDTPHEHFIECACELFTTIGYFMERNPHTAEIFDSLMHKLENLKNSETYSSRINFKIQDLVDLRASRWRAKLKGNEKASTLTELHQKIADEDAQGGAIIMAQKGEFATMGEPTRQAYDNYLERYRRDMKQLGKASFSSALLQAAQTKRRASAVAITPSRSISPSTRRGSIVQNDSRRHSMLNIRGTPLQPSDPQHNASYSRDTTQTTQRSEDDVVGQDVKHNIGHASNGRTSVGSKEAVPAISRENSLARTSNASRSSTTEFLGSGSMELSEEVSEAFVNELIKELRSIDDVPQFVSSLLSLKLHPTKLATEFNNLLETAAWENGPRGLAYIEALIKVYRGGNVSPQPVVARISDCLQSLDDYTLDNPQAPKLFGRLVGSLVFECLGSIWDRYFISVNHNAKPYQPRAVAGVEELLRGMQLPDHPVVFKFASTLATVDHPSSNPSEALNLTRSLWISINLFAIAVSEISKLDSINSIVQAIGKALDLVLESSGNAITLTPYHVAAIHMTVDGPKSFNTEDVISTLKAFNLDTSNVQRVTTELLFIDTLRRRPVSSRSSASPPSASSTSPWKLALSSFPPNVVQSVIINLSSQSTIPLSSLLQSFL